MTDNGSQQQSDDTSKTNESICAEELRLARSEIIGLRVEAARLALQVDDMRRQLKAARSVATRYSQQISAMRGSLSWRVTMPLRLMRRRSIESRITKRAD